MNIEDLTLKQLREIASLARAVDEGSPLVGHPLVGKCVFVRTVTHPHVGRLVEATPTDLVLEDAAWVASYGRFAQALADGTLDEVEPFPEGRVWVNRGAVIDVCEWRHDLPRTQK